MLPGWICWRRISSDLVISDWWSVDRSLKRPKKSKKIMRLTLSILVFITGLLSSEKALGQTMPSKKEQYDFLKWYINHTKLPSLSDSTVNFLNGPEFTIKDFRGTLKQSSAITVADVKLITKQIRLIDNNKVVLDTLILKHSDWKSISNKTNTESYISLPVFSASRKFAFIMHGFYCGGTCGHEGIEVYIKTRKEWKPFYGFALPYSVF